LRTSQSCSAGWSATWPATTTRRAGQQLQHPAAPRRGLDEPALRGAVRGTGHLQVDSWLALGRPGRPVFWRSDFGNGFASPSEPGARSSLSWLPAGPSPAPAQLPAPRSARPALAVRSAARRSPRPRPRLPAAASPRRSRTGGPHLHGRCCPAIMRPPSRMWPRATPGRWPASPGGQRHEQLQPRPPGRHAAHCRQPGPPGHHPGGSRAAGSMAVPGYREGYGDCSRILWAVRGSDRQPPVIFTAHGPPSPSQLTVANLGSKRFGEPPLLPGFRPPYVRNVRREVAHCECCDTMSHVVSVLVKEVWLMPET
jgi:hypothetical protein